MAELYRSYCIKCDTEYTWKDPAETEDNDKRPLERRKTECLHCKTSGLKTEEDWGNSIRSVYFSFP